MGKFKNKERTLKSREYAYAGLFEHIGKGRKLHVPLDLYSATAVQVECYRQNRYAGCKPMDKKFVTSTTEKEGYITIFQRF